ncbi:MAG: hypothetical protein JRN06_01720 [Nitrososphaerota archaeon]|nr:hypothetical protein [Nitrososphaerota archaeon]MDG7023427.1 hypothetical protein [Nitrososphaerota archaeon]
MDGREKASLVALVVSALVVAATIVLPALSFPQTESLAGPQAPYDGSSYTISAYYIPTVPAGVPVEVQLSGYAPGTVILSLFPTTQNDIAPAGSPIITFQSPTKNNVSGSFTSPTTQPYGIYVVSYNNTGYRLRVNSEWSPYYVVRIYTYPAVFAVIVCTIFLYYFRQTAARRKAEREVMESIGRLGKREQQFPARKAATEVRLWQPARPYGQRW